MEDVNTFYLYLQANKKINKKISPQNIILYHSRRYWLNWADIQHTIFENLFRGAVRRLKEPVPPVITIKN
jgi:hypothetical protein